MVKSLTLVASAMLATSLYAQEPLVTLEDRGGILIKDILNPDDDEKPSIEELMGEKPKPKDNGLLSEALYPVISERLSVGPVGPDEARDIPSYLLTRPFFIVGADRVSANWMKSNLDLLVERQAIGLVVNVESPDHMRRLIELTERRLPLTPMPADQLASAINLKHYPVYIDNSGVLR